MSKIENHETYNLSQFYTKSQKTLIIIYAIFFALIIGIGIAIATTIDLTSYDQGSFSNDNLGINTMSGQSFKVTASSTDTVKITGFKFKLTKGNTTPCNSSTGLTIELRETNPTGTLLYSGTHACDTLPAYGTYSTPTQFNISTTTATSTNTTFWVGYKATNGSGSDVIRESIDISSPTYTDGTRWRSGTEYTAQDMDFWVLGIYEATTTGSTSTTTTTSTTTIETGDLIFGLAIIAFLLCFIFFGIIFNLFK